MPTTGKYCKAYYLKLLKEYPNWKKTDGSVATSDVDASVASKDDELSDNAIVYIQENYTVTKDIFLDRDLIFDSVTDDWKAFCQTKLDFQVPKF